MNLKVKGKIPEKTKQKLREAASFYFKNLEINEAFLNFLKLKIIVKNFSRKQKDFRAFCSPEDDAFEIHINKMSKNYVKTLAHEFVHLKQHLYGETLFSEDNKCYWYGKLWEPKDDEDFYYNSPWEIEAYEKEQVLYEQWCEQTTQTKENH